MADSEFALLLENYLPAAKIDGGVNPASLICTLGKNPDAKKIQEYCIKRCHCKNLAPKSVLKDEDMDF